MVFAFGVGTRQGDKDGDGTVSLSEWKEVIKLAMSGERGDGADANADPDARAAGYALFKSLFLCSIELLVIFLLMMRMLRCLAAPALHDPDWFVWVDVTFRRQRVGDAIPRGRWLPYVC